MTRTRKCQLGLSHHVPFWKTPWGLLWLLRGDQVWTTDPRGLGAVTPSAHDKSEADGAGVC